MSTNDTIAGADWPAVLKQIMVERFEDEQTMAEAHTLAIVQLAEVNLNGHGDLAGNLRGCIVAAIFAVQQAQGHNVPTAMWIAQRLADALFSEITGEGELCEDCNQDVESAVLSLQRLANGEPS